MFVAQCGVRFYSEMVRTERGRKSEEVKNGEGVAAGGATNILQIKSIYILSV